MYVYSYKSQKAVKMFLSQNNHLLTLKWGQSSSSSSSATIRAFLQTVFLFFYLIQ